METPRTRPAFAADELSPVTERRPELRGEAIKRADYVYFRVYARIRLAEALRQIEETRGVSLLFEGMHPETKRLVAVGLNHLTEKVVSPIP